MKISKAHGLLGLLDQLSEKWGGDTEINPSKKGMWTGWSQEDLQAERSKLKASGPHDAGSAQATRLKEVNFALRAKGAGGKKWGKVE